jgi:4-hydroxy-3-polyprenylbenzoate decarboxylase
LQEMVDFLVVRLFDGLEEDLAPLKRWNGPLE